MNFLDLDSCDVSSGMITIEKLLRFFMYLNTDIFTE